VSFGSHTCTHPRLSRLPPAQAHDELARSKEMLDSRVPQPCTAIAYPYGDSNRVVQHLAEKAEALYPLDGGLPATEAPEKRLHAFIRGHLSRMFDPERLGYLHRIRMAEMFDPTGLLAAPLKKRLAKDRNQILTILRELLGPAAERKDLEWCEMSVVSQCLVAAPGPTDEGPRRIFGLAAEDVEHLAAHILTFSLAGIAAIRQNLENRAAKDGGPTAK